MQAKKRYLLAASTLITLLVCYYGISRPKLWHGGPHAPPLLQTFMGEDDFTDDHDIRLSPRKKRDTLEVSQAKTSSYSNCRMETCFNFDKCQHGFKVYVYPIQEKISNIYQEILSAFKESQYYTSIPEEACLFVLSIDTIERDNRGNHYVRNLPEKIKSLELWNNGENHVIFNLYAGTWPDYLEEDLGFDIGKAILAKASFSHEHYRPGYDISFPLFHEEHPSKGGEVGYLTQNSVPPIRKYTLAFKGKRYLTGIGSESRNSLYHIHNGEDIILLTTCKHGKVPKNIIDERCEQDDVEYDKWDYKVLLHNSTFCLVPRGRRLGSFRFLETLQAACIPVILSNGWVLPFSEVIDWNKVAVWGDERLLLQVPSIVRSIPQADILLLRQQTQFLWNTYFSSIEKIVQTTLEILKERVYSQLMRSQFVWNTQPGALVTLPDYSNDLTNFPFFWSQLAASGPPTFTAVIYSTGMSSASVLSSPATATNTPLFRLIRSLVKSVYCGKIVILWHCDSSPPPHDVKWPAPATLPVTVRVIQSVNQRFYAWDDIEGSSVLSLDEDTILTTDEVDFAFHVWTYFPDRIVGYAARTHFWDDSTGRWAYSSKSTNSYSMVLTGAAFLHRYYLYLYTHYVSSHLLAVVHDSGNCEDILMNFLVSHVTKLPPLKLTQRKTVRESETVSQSGDKPAWPLPGKFGQRQSCINTFVDHYGYMPLLRSNLRLDPVLYKDAVSILRKKYRQIERV